MLDPKLDEDALWARLPTLDSADLASLLDHPAVKDRHFVKLLQRQDLTSEFLTRVAKSRWVGSARVQFCLVNHPRTPLVESMNLVKFLFWRDLNLVIQNFRLASEVRHLAEAALQQRLPAMAVGEKVTLARIAAGQVLKMLRLEKDGRIIQALLENSRLVEEDVLYLVSQARTPAPVLEAVCRDPKWSCRREVRIALLRNPRTPLAAAITFVSSLTATEMRELLNDPKVPIAIRKMLQRKLGKLG
jgi:hypothetical protein